MEILVFGASIASGYNDIEGGWVAKLKKYLEEKYSQNENYYCPVFNLGIPGNTTRDVLKRFEFEIRQRLNESRRIILIEVGLNDSQIDIESKTLEITLNEFSKNILQLIKLAKKYSSEIIFLGLTPVDETKTDPIPWKPGSSYKNEEIKQFDRIIKDLSRENYVGFVNISKVFNQQSCKKLLEDGVHPNSKGHEKIFYLVKTFLEKNNNI